MNDIDAGAVEISEVTGNELEELAKLCAETFYNTYFQQNTPEDMELYLNTHFTLDHILKEYQNPAITFFVARFNNKLIGYLKLEQGNSSYVPEGVGFEIARYYVAEQYQKLKIGRQMMNIATAFALKNNCTYLWLGVWQKNSSAVSIYKHIGFEIVGTTTFVLGADVQHDFVMVKKPDV